MNFEVLTGIATSAGATMDEVIGRNSEGLQHSRRREAVSSTTSNQLSINEILNLLHTPLDILELQAEEITRDQFQGRVMPMASISFSNYCKLNCSHCRYRKDHQELQRFRMIPENIINTAKQVVNQGTSRILLRSSYDVAYSSEMLSSIIREISSLGPVSVHAQFGTRPHKDYKDWKKAGLYGYALRFVTSSKKLMRWLCDRDYPAQPEVDLGVLNRLGVFLACGSTLGLPRQSLEDIATDLELFARHSVDMLILTPFTPHPMTPLALAPAMPSGLYRRVMAVARILIPEVDILVSENAIASRIDMEDLLRIGATSILINALPNVYEDRDVRTSYRQQAVTFKDRLDFYTARIESAGFTFV